MKASPLRDLVTLAALWSASFLFMRVITPAFGPLPMAAVRVAGAALLLLPLLAWRRELPSLTTHWRALLVVGVTNSALPFALFGFAALHLTGGLSAVFNAATPLFAALIAWLWLRQTLTPWRIAGLGIGFIGVSGLAWVRADGTEAGGPVLAIAACLLAPLSYGFAANFTRKYLTGVPSLVVATGSQIAAALALAVPAALTWPEHNPAPVQWGQMAALALFCTGIAYILFFRLIAQAGAAYATTVTYLVPAFAVLWGGLFLAESVSFALVVGCVVILVGTALATGAWPRAAPAG